MISSSLRGGLAGLCLALLPGASGAWAGECNCAGTTDRDNSNKQWSITIQFESMSMGTLLQGSQAVQPTQVIEQALAKGQSRMFSVPTSMLMQRSTVRTRYRVDDDNSIILSIPFSVSNQMDMLMGMKPMPATPGMGGMPMPMPAMPMFSSMTMSPINQVGDVAVLVQSDLLRDDSGNTLTLSGGIKLPTGDYQVRTAQGRLVHAMMQPGTGSVDLFVGVSGLAWLGGGPDGQTWSLEPGLTYQLNGTNSLGYRFGNRLGYDLKLNCRLGESFTLTTALNGIVTGRDSQNGTLDPQTGTTAYQSPTTSLIDNVANTGASMLYLAPGLQWKLSDDVTLRAHHRIPLSRSVNGTQIVTDSWTTVNLSVGF